MRHQEFTHTLQAAADIVKDEIVVVGSQAVLGQFADAPESLLRSLEVDVFPRSDPDRADEIDGAMGDGSRFHETYGYYAHGVGPETVVAPVGWEGRLVRVELPAIRPHEAKVVAWCLEVHDLVLAKIAAGRPHDLDFVADALAAGLVTAEELELGIDLMPESHRELTRARLAGLGTRACGARSFDPAAG
jgi:hypothetical protein